MPEPDDKVCHSSRDKHLTRTAQGHNSGRNMDSQSGHVVPTSFDLPRMESSTNIEAELDDSLAEGTGALNCPRRSVKDSKGAIPGRFDLTASKPLQMTPGKVIVSIEHFSPLSISKLGRSLGRTNDVGEQHRGKYPVQNGAGPCARHKLLHLVENLLAPTSEGPVVISREFDQPGVTDELGQIAAVFRTNMSVPGPT